MKDLRTRWKSVLILALSSLWIFSSASATVWHSASIALVPNATGRYSGAGTLPTVFPGMSFTNVGVSEVNASRLASFDTMVLNQIGDAGTVFTAQQKADINAWIYAGGKLLIYDSDACPSVDYSWLVYPFTTNNPGQLGSNSGTLTIVEENQLSSNDPASPYYINTAWLSSNTDAVGDSNVMTTAHSNWFGDMEAKNANGVTGWVHAYAEYGHGLIIYNGLDTDDIGWDDGWIEKCWRLELEKYWDPSDLPRGNPVVSGKLRFYIDKNNNGDYDEGEQVAGESVYFRNRSKPLGVKTATDGTIRITNIRVGDQLFVRHLAYSEPAVKKAREFAGSMFDLYMDTDAVGGTGDLVPYTITEAVARQLAQGQTVAIPLGHPVFSWNLVASVSWNADASYLGNLKEGFRRASDFLYDATDGQMKLGRVDIHNDVSKYSTLYLLDSDVQMVTGDGRAGTHLGDVARRGWKHGIWMPMKEYGDAPSSHGFASTLIHEFGHYALALYDEYLNGKGNDEDWFKYRSEHTTEAPSDYGLMESNGNEEMSSTDEYLATYAEYRFPALCYGPVPCDAHRVSLQVLKYELAADHNVHLPCWQYVKKRFDNSTGTLETWHGYNGIRVMLSLPPDGVYETKCRQSNGFCYRPPAWDKARPGPQNMVPPYVRCDFPAATSTVLTAAGQPCEVVDLGSGSFISKGLVFLDKVDGTRAYYGHPDSNGLIALPGMEESDNLRFFSDGSVRDIDINCGSREDMAQPRSVREAEPSVAGPRLLLSAVVVPDAETTLHLLIFADATLSSVPAVTIRPFCAGGIAATPVQTGPLTWSAEVGIGTATEGCVEVSAASAGGQTTIASLFTVNDHPVAEPLCVQSPEGLMDAHLPSGLVTQDCMSVSVGSGTAPVLPSDLVLLTEPTAFHLSDPVDPGEYFTLNWKLSPDSALGCDAANVCMIRFDETSWQWLQVPSSFTPGHDVVSADDVPQGIYAVAAVASDDAIAPGGIVDLAIGDNASCGGVSLTWTAPGDDGMAGTATSYRVWYSEGPIIPDSLSSCHELPLEYPPLPSGIVEDRCFFPPTPGARYYFALQAVDEAGNRGPLSNVIDTVCFVEDTDSDGMPDRWEDGFGLDPQLPGDANLDSDDDGLTNVEEYAHGTLPVVSDTDGDGFGDGLEVRAATSPIDISDPQSVTPGQAKLIANGAKVGLCQVQTTASFDDVTYAQASDRSSGIALLGSSIAPRNSADVIGTVSTLPNGDRCLSSCACGQLWATPVEPVSMNNASIGGGPLGYQGGITGGTGANNIGLLVRTWGRISYVHPASTFVYVDDGSNVCDGNSLGQGGSSVLGIRIICPPGIVSPPAGTHVSVTGISCRYELNGPPVRAIRIRGDSDLRDVDNRVFIMGTVRTADGSPVEDALVETDDGHSSAQTDASGGYALAVPWQWSGTVAVSKTGFASFEPSSRTYSLMSTNLSGQDYTGDRMLLISGRVTTGDGSPVENVEVYTDDDWYYTDSDGYYSLYVPSGWSGTIKVYVWDARVVPPGRSYSNVTADIPVQNYTAIPWPVISGYVRTADGTPIESVVIYTDDEGVWAQTDSSGYYSLTVPFGWCGTVHTGSDLWATDPRDRSYTSVTADIPNQDYLALARVMISGCVKTADGTPVEGIEVYTDDGNGYTDSGGYYAVHVPPGWSGTVRTLDDVWSTDPLSRDYTSVTGDIPNQDYTAVAKVLISGYVKTADGTAVRSVEVYTDDDYDYTDSSGYYTLHVSPGWSGTVRTRNDDWSTDPRTRSYADVTADISDQNYTAIANPVISGCVKTADGTPVEDVQLYTDDDWDSTDSSGYYSLHVTPGWTGTVHTWAESWATEPRDRPYTAVTSDMVDQDYVAMPKVMISGRVATASGESLADVMIADETGDNCTWTDVSGNYAIGVPPGWSGSLTVYADGYGTQPARRSYSAVNAPVTDQDYTAAVSAWQVISGSVRTADGKPAMDVYMSTVYDYGRTDWSGAYRLYVPPGWSGVVTPWSETWALTPLTRDYDNVLANVSGEDYLAAPRQ